MILKVTIIKEGEDLGSYTTRLPAGTDLEDLEIGAEIYHDDIETLDILTAAGQAIRDGMIRGLGTSRDEILREARAKARRSRRDIPPNGPAGCPSDEDGSDWAIEAYDGLVDDAIEALIYTLRDLTD